MGIAWLNEQGVSNKDGIVFCQVKMDARGAAARRATDCYLWAKQNPLEDYMYYFREMVRLGDRYFYFYPHLVWI